MILEQGGIHSQDAEPLTDHAGVDFLDIPHVRNQIRVSLYAQGGLGSLGGYFIQFPESRHDPEPAEAVFPEDLQLMLDTFMRNVEIVNDWSPGKINPEEARAYANACLRANVIVTAGADDWDMGATALEHFLFTKGIVLPPESSQNIIEVVDRILTTDNSHERRSHLEQDPRCGVMTSLVLIGQNAIASEKAGGEVDSERLARLEGMLLDITASELPPTFSPTDSFAYYFRSQFSRALVLLKDILSNTICPHTIEMANQAVGAITQNPNYAERAHIHPYQFLRENPFKEQIHSTQDALHQVKEGEWNEHEHAFGVEASVKGLWGAVEDYFLQPEAMEHVHGLAKEYSLSSCSKEWEESRYRRTRALTVGSLFEQLITIHGDDPRVIALQNNMLNHVNSLHDHIRLRLNVGSVGWDKIFPEIKKCEDARVIMGTTNMNGATEVYDTSVAEALHVMEAEGNLPSLPGAIRARLLQGYEGVRRIHKQRKMFAKPDEIVEPDIRDVFAAWVLGAGDPSEADVLPYASVHVVGKTADGIPVETQIAPYSGDSVLIAKTNWQTRQLYNLIYTGQT